MQEMAFSLQTRHFCENNYSSSWCAEVLKVDFNGCRLVFINIYGGSLDLLEIFELNINIIQQTCPQVV